MMIFILLFLLGDANQSAVEIFNRMSKEKKLILLRFLKKMYFDDFDKQIALFKNMHREYESKKIELRELQQFGIEQGYSDDTEEMFNSQDYQISDIFKNVDSFEDM